MILARRIAARASRPTAEASITHPRANPLTIQVYPNEGALPISGATLLRAELRAGRTDTNTPLATVEMANPPGSGPWTLAFSGPQLNQDLLGRSSRALWLVIYMLDGAGSRDTLYTAILTLTEDGASLESAVPPAVETLLDQPTADGRYAPLSLTGEMEAALDQLEELTPLLGDVEQIKTQLAALLYIPMAITSLANSVGTVEIGSAVTSLTLTWTVNKSPVSLSLSQGIGSVPANSTTITRAVNLSADTAYTLTADDGTAYAGHSASASTTVQFRHRAYWGTSAAAGLDSAGIRVLAGQAFGTARARSFTLNGGGQYLYYAYPASWGDAVFTINGLISTAWTKSLVNFTNASGNTTSFAVWRSDTVQNGTGIQISVS